MSSILDQIFELAPLTIRIVAVGASVLSIISGLLNILMPHQYTTFAVSIWTTALGFGAFACETNPEAFNRLLTLFPFLGRS